MVNTLPTYIADATPVTEPVRPRAAIKIRGELWTCTPDGQPIDDVTPYVASAVVTYNWLNEIKGSLRVQLRKNLVTRAILDCLMPMVTITWRSSNGIYHEIRREPLGVFYYLPPDEEATETTLTRSLDGMDGLWRLGQLTADRMYWFDTGTDYGEAAVELLDGQSPVPLDLDRTASTVVTPRTVLPNTYLLKHANDLYMAGDYWDLAADRTGTIRTSRRTVLGQSAPARIIDSRLGDILANTPIRRVPDRDAFCNQVFISSNNPEADLTLRDGYKVSFTDPASEFNIYRSPVISKAVSDSRDESFQTMRNRALLILEAAAGMQRRITIPVWPDPRVSPREAWELHISQRDGFVLADGMFRVEELTFGFTGDSMAQLVTLSELVDIQHVVEGTS